MSMNLKELENYLSQHPLVYGNCEVGTVIEAICDFYMMNSGPETEVVKQLLTELEASTQMLSFAQQDAIFSTVSCLGTRWERDVFLTGLWIGAQLTLEMSEKENCHCEQACSQ